MQEVPVGQAEVFDVVHARILRFFPDLVDQLGGDPRRLMQQVGIHPGKRLSEGGSDATYRQIVRLMEVAATHLRCPDFGMRLAARVWIKRSRSRKSAFVGHDILLDRMPNKGQAMEQILLLGHLAAAEITGGQARVRQVHFRHHPVSPLRAYRRYFGCAVRFGQNEDGVVFSEKDLASPSIDPDSRVYQAATSFIDSKFTRHRPPLHAQARGVIMQLLGTEHCTNDRIATELNLHPRTMHRRLSAEGTSFQRIKDEVRRDVMLYYLEQTNLDFALISERLGFAEQSVMTRSCHRWFGAAPTKLRSQGRRLTLAS
jgi:AraC-like DNA-binding protein